MYEILIWGIVAVVLSLLVLVAHYTLAAIRAEHLLLLRSHAYGIGCLSGEPTECTDAFRWLACRLL